MVAHQSDQGLVRGPHVRPLGRELLRGLSEDEGGEPERVDLAVMPVFTNERPLQGLAGFVDWRACGRLSHLVRADVCTAAVGEQVLSGGCRTLPFARFLLLGLGHSGRFDRERARAAALRVVELGRELGAESLIVPVPTALVSREVGEEFGRALGEHIGPAHSGRSEPREGADSSVAAPDPFYILVPPHLVARYRRLLVGPPRAATGEA